MWKRRCLHYAGIVFFCWSSRGVEVQCVRPEGASLSGLLFQGDAVPLVHSLPKGYYPFGIPFFAAYGVFICFYSASAATAVVVVASASAVIAAAVEEKDEEKNKKDDAPAVVSVKA